MNILQQAVAVQEQSVPALGMLAQVLQQQEAIEAQPQNGEGGAAYDAGAEEAVGGGAAGGHYDADGALSDVSEAGSSGEDSGAQGEDGDAARPAGESGDGVNYAVEVLL